MVVIPGAMAIFWVLRHLWPSLVRNWHGRDYISALLNVSAIIMSIIVICYIGAKIILSVNI
jgi:hypothetical protein